MTIVSKIKKISILIRLSGVSTLMLAACLLALTQKCDAMDNSIYTTLSNQIALNDELSITANNMANANTTGFKKDVQIMSSYTARDKISDLKIPNDIASISDFTSQ